MSAGERVVVLGFDAMDPALVAAMADDGRLPAFAALRESAVSCEVRNPVGLFVGTLWSTFFTGCSAAHTGFHCWEEIVPGSYEKRLTSPASIRGTPVWETLSEAGRRVAVIDVPHTRAGAPLNGVQVSEWGAHDRHFGLRTYPPELAGELVERFGAHPVLGADPFAVRDWAPDDYLFRAGPHRTGEEDEQLLDGLLAGAEAKTRLSGAMMQDGPWDLFMVVYGEPHSIGHQCWHVHDRAHPRHDPALRRRIGDPLERVYTQMDRALAAHLETASPEATVLVMLSHGIGPHFDATHLLAEILRRLDGAYRGSTGRSWQGRALGRGWSAMPAGARAASAPVLARALARRAAQRQLRPVREDDAAAERAQQLFFMTPNNFVVGGIRVNLRGREPSGMVAPGREFDELCKRLEHDLLSLVNIDAGEPVVTRVQRSDAHYSRDRSDALPDLLIDWNHRHLIETIWSPRVGLIHGPYTHWRTGDHSPRGLLLARGPGIAPGARPPEIRIEDLAPSIAARLGVAMTEADGSPVGWLSGQPLTAPRT